MAVRPRLHPSFRPMRRPDGTVQLGVTAEAGGILVAGLAPPEVTLLERLDGSLSEPDVYALAAGWGVPHRRAAELLGLLRDRRILLDAGVDAKDHHPAVPIRARQHVVVSGGGPLPAAVAALLRASGVGRVEAGPWAVDLAEAQLRERLGRTLRPGPPSRPGPPGPPGQPGPPGLPGLPGPAPHLVVLVTAHALDPTAGAAWTRSRVPVLPVLVDAVRVIVGPLVGLDPADPCLSCLAMTRADLHPGWPAPPAPPAAPAPSDPGETGLDPALLSVAAGAVAMVAAAALGGDEVPAGVSVEVGLPWPRLDHRRWERHPGCRGHTRSASSAHSTGPP